MKMSETQDPVADVPLVTFKKRNTKTKSTFRKREATPPASDSDSGFTSSEDEEGRQIKRRRKNPGISATSMVKPATGDASTKNISSSFPSTIATTKDDATKASNWYDEKDAEKSKSKAKSEPQETAPSDGTYRGTANYQSFIQKNPDRQPKQVGPINASSNVRTITVTDFAPDVCKDYKQTGFCGFGDSCKFLHAREDYKQGWQLDRDWEVGTKGKKLTGRTVASADRDAKAAKEDEEDEALLESIPFACIICKSSYSNPIVTKCGHYFCEACAIKRYRKDPSCAACGASTGGIFTVAKKLNKLLDKKRERERLRKEKGLDDGEAAS